VCPRSRNNRVKGVEAFYRLACNELSIALLDATLSDLIPIVLRHVREFAGRSELASIW